MHVDESSLVKKLVYCKCGLRTHPHRRIEQVGSASENFDKPRSSYVAKFLGINTFNGMAVKSSDGLLEIEANGIRLLAANTPSGLIGKNVVVTLKTEVIS